MFLLMSVYSQGGPYVTITHDTLDLTVQAQNNPCPPSQTSDLETAQPSKTSELGPIFGTPVVTSGGNHWRTVRICSFGGDIWWRLLKHIQLVQADDTHPTGTPSCLSM